MAMEKHGDISPESTPPEQLRLVDQPHMKAMMAKEDQKFLAAVNKSCCGGGCDKVAEPNKTVKEVDALEKLADDTSQRLAEQAADPIPIKPTVEVFNDLKPVVDKDEPTE
jgi:hypothetical protein